MKINRKGILNTSCLGFVIIKKETSTVFVGFQIFISHRYIYSREEREDKVELFLI